MNYAAIRNHDIANGEGVRTSLFVSGCTNHCPGCFNPEEQDFSYGEPYTEGTEQKILSMIADPVIAGLSILGGDPLCQNAKGLGQLIALCRKVHRLRKNIWLWTGFEWEYIFRQHKRSDITDFQQTLVESCDVVVDGLFVEALSGRALKWRGSANQRVINVRESLGNRIVLYK